MKYWSLSQRLFHGNISSLKKKNQLKEKNPTLTRNWFQNQIFQDIGHKNQVTFQLISSLVTSSSLYIHFFETIVIIIISWVSASCLIQFQVFYHMIHLSSHSILREMLFSSYRQYNWGSDWLFCPNKRQTGPLNWSKKAYRGLNYFPWGIQKDGSRNTPGIHKSQIHNPVSFCHFCHWSGKR